MNRLFYFILSVAISTLLSSVITLSDVTRIDFHNIGSKENRI